MGLRRTETAKLDLTDWGRNPAAAEFGWFGMLHVRYGKAVRGQLQAAQRCVGDGLGGGGGDRLRRQRPAAVGGGSSGAVGDRAGWEDQTGRDQRPLVAYRDALGLPRALTPHSLRHSYVTHLTEDGADRRFPQEQVGHRCDTSTAIYTHVSGDFEHRAAQGDRPGTGPAGRTRIDRR